MHGIAQQHESGAVVGQVIADFFERLVYYFVVVLLDFFGGLID